MMSNNTPNDRGEQTFFVSAVEQELLANPIVTVQASQVVALLPLRMTGNGVAATIAIADERILFLIIKPFHLRQSQSAQNRPTSPMESL